MAFPFFLAGAVFALWSNIYLLDIGKGGPMEGFNMAISPRTKKLVVTGPYRYCRNPMVFGAFMLYVSVSVYLTSIICLFILLIFLFLARVYLSAFEEKRLLKDFGDEYIDYKNKVSMIFPLKTIDNK
jgi:protein-S-isoprenylcysteine O-methyltransferase Ste14